MTPFGEPWLHIIAGCDGWGVRSKRQRVESLRVGKFFISCLGPCTMTVDAVKSGIPRLTSPHGMLQANFGDAGICEKSDRGAVSSPGHPVEKRQSVTVGLKDREPNA